MPNDAEIGEDIFMSAREVRAWRARGVIPPVGTPLLEVREKYIRHLREAAANRIASPEKSDLDSEKARLASEQADQIAMRNAQMRGELVPLAEVSQAVIGMIEVAKAKLARVAAKVAGSDSGLKTRIARAIEDALGDISATRALERQPDHRGRANRE